MAQLVEQRIRNAWVAGSSPAIGSLNPQTRVRTPTVLALFLLSGISSVGRALASQAEGRGFESRIPLKREEKFRKKRKKSLKNLQGSKNNDTFAPAIKEITPRFLTPRS